MVEKADITQHTRNHDMEQSRAKLSTWLGGWRTAAIQVLLQIDRIPRATLSSPLPNPFHHRAPKPWLLACTKEEAAYSAMTQNCWTFNLFSILIGDYQGELPRLRSVRL